MRGRNLSPPLAGPRNMRWFDESKREPYTDLGIFIAYKEDGMPRDGWLKRQTENTERNIADWPRWMRIESGVAVSKLFLAVPTYHTAAGARTFPTMGIIAFTPREARERIVEYCATRHASANPRYWGVRDLRVLPDVEDVPLHRAAEVLVCTGITVLEIVEKGREERACSFRPRPPRQK